MALTSTRNLLSYTYTSLGTYVYKVLGYPLQ